MEYSQLGLKLENFAELYRVNNTVVWFLENKVFLLPYLLQRCQILNFLHSANCIFNERGTDLVYCIINTLNVMSSTQ